MSEAPGDVVRQRGLWFEELRTGIVYKHSPGRTIGEADNTLFSTLTMNPQSLHLDAAFSADTEFGERLVNSLLTMSVLVGLSVGHLTQGTIVANLGFSDARFPVPVRHGDTIYGETVVTEQAPVGEPAGPGHRDLRAHRAQPARRGGGRGHQDDADAVPARRRGPARPAGQPVSAERTAEDGAVTPRRAARARAALLPRRPARPVREGARRRRRGHPRPRGRRGTRRQGRGAGRARRHRPGPRAGHRPGQRHGDRGARGRHGGPAGNRVPADHAAQDASRARSWTGSAATGG